MLRRIAILSLVGMILTAGTGYAFEDQALVPTNEQLEEVKTEHFHIIYQKSLQSALPYLVEQAEEAYQALTSIFKWYPSKKTEILFIDATDTHNGWATTIPHNQICIYACGAEPGSPIFQPGSYLQRTLYHELAHVLSMDMRYGYNRAFSNVFGKMLPINADPLSTLLFFLSSSPVTLAPNWYLEGVAIWAETEFTNQGRGRASIPEMIFRCAVQENNLLPYSEWDLDIPHWPYGLGTYLYGMKLIQYVSETSQYVSGSSEDSSSQEPVGELVQSLSHAFMFNFDSHSVKVTGQKFETLAQKMLVHEMRIQQDNITKLKKVRLTRISRLTNRKTLVFQPVWAGNKIYFAGQEEETRDSLYVYLPQQNKTNKIASVPLSAAFSSLRASSDGRFIYYTRLEVQHKDDLWYEVRRFEPETKKDILITDLGRYRSIDVSPDGQRLAAVSMRAGKSFLIETALAEAGKKENLLACTAFQESLNSPRYSPDGERIAYVRGNDLGFSLLVFDRKKRSSQLVYHSHHQVLFPTWHHKNIVFSSDQNGVYNLYEIPTDGTDGALSREPVPLTHVIGGIFASDFTPDDKTIAAVAYDSYGYYLTVLPYQPLAGQKLPSIQATWKGKKRKKEPTKTQSVATPYCSGKNIQFNYWGPWLTASSYGLEGGLGAVFSDPTGYQNLQLIGGVESEYGTSLAAIRYAYKGFYPTLYLYAGQDQQVYPRLLRAADDTRRDVAERVTTIGSAVDIPLIKRDSQISLQIGYQRLERDSIRPANFSEKSEADLWARVSGFNGTAFRRSCSIEDGHFIAVTAEKAHTSLGGELDRIRMLGEWNEYISTPWAKNHVLKLSGCYGFGEGDQTYQGLFGLGGFNSSIVSTTLGMPRSIPLRGYEENFQTGNCIAKISCAYRFPLLDISKGLSGSTPVYYKQLFAEVFYDGGRCGSLDNNRGWINGLGMEVNFALKLLRFGRLAPGLGIVYAPDQVKSGSNNNKNTYFQIYLNIKGFVNF